MMITGLISHEDPHYNGPYLVRILVDVRHGQAVVLPVYTTYSRIERSTCSYNSLPSQSACSLRRRDCPYSLDEGTHLQQ